MSSGTARTCGTSGSMAAANGRRSRTSSVPAATPRSGRGAPASRRDAPHHLRALVGEFGEESRSLANDGEAMETKKASRKTSQKRWPPGKPLPRLATAAEEERFWLSHDFDEAMEAGGKEVVYEPQATRQARTHVYRVRLDDLEMSTLQALARRRGVNASVVLRELVRAARPARAGEIGTK
jgi:hypothetical protein